jgi:amino acid adenylation domain-containing protein
MGVLKAGCLYVPIDSTYPEERISYMLSNGGLNLLFTQEKLSNLFEGSSVKQVCVDRDSEKIDSQNAVNIGVNLSPFYSAYRIYTSGSTGVPKGVQVSHKSVVNLVYAIRQQLEFTEADSLLAMAPISFDMSVLELYLPLLCGARMNLVSQGRSSDPDILVKTLEKYNSTVLQSTPSTWQMLLSYDYLPKNNPVILCGGEAWPSNLADKLRSCSSRVFNMYGPTESTVWVTGVQLSDKQDATIIGDAIANTAVYVLDSWLQPTPIGVVGEVHISSHGLASGYAEQPELTAEKFIPNPFDDGFSSRLYKTGDLARYKKDGSIEFVGRGDDQVKVRGFRVELGEVESKLLSHGDVGEVKVLLRETYNFDKRLCAYLVSAPGKKLPSTRMLRSYLKSLVPDYMVPSYFVELDALPLSPSGKVDVKALPMFGKLTDELTREYVAPRNDLEEKVSRIWEEVLQLEKVGMYADFFELGGHSLLATQVVARIKERLGLVIPVRTLFENTTIDQICKEIEYYKMEEELFTNKRQATEDDVEFTL